MTQSTNTVSAAVDAAKTAVKSDVVAAETKAVDAAKTVVVKQESWVRANRKALIIGAAVVVALVLAVHFL